MATYFDDCTSLTNWTESGWNAGAQFSLSGGYIAHTGTNSEALRFVPSNTDADRDDVELVIRLNNEAVSSTYRRIAYILVGDDSALANMSGYAVWSNSARARIYRYDSGTETPIATPSTSIALYAGVDFWVRFRRSGTTLYVKSWLGEAEDEHVGWDGSVTDATYSTAGAVGLLTTGLSTDRWFKAFGVGTNGDTAPTSGTPASTGVRGRGLLMGIG